MSDTVESSSGRCSGKVEPSNGEAGSRAAQL